MNQPSPVLLLGLVSAVLMPLSIRIMRQIALDVPNERSSHTQPTPRAGGVPVILGTTVAIGGVAVVTDTVDATVWVALVGCALFGAVGFLDDLCTLPAMPRLGLQLAISAGLLMATGGLHYSLLAVGTLFLASSINAFNFMDGINGMSAVTALVGCTTSGLVAYAIGASDVMVLSFAIAAAALGFMPYNAPSARSFLGDSGSYFLGGAMGYLAFRLIERGAPPAVAIAPLALYFADTASTMVRRLVAGRNIFAAHREHAYQFLARRIGHLATTAVFGVLTVALIAATMSTWSMKAWLPVVAVSLMALLAVTAIRRAGSRRAAA